MKPLPVDLEELAKRIRELYCTEMRAYLLRHRGERSSYGSRIMPRWDGGERAADGKVFQPVWPKLAALVTAEAIDPEKLIKAAFGIRFGGSPPTPHQCIGQQALNALRVKAEQEPADVCHDLDLALASQQQTVANNLLLRAAYKRLGWSDLDVLTNVLLDRGLSVSPLLRYALAKKAGLLQVAKHCQSAAVEQYLFDKDRYEQCWADWIDDELRELAYQARAGAAVIDRGNRLRRSDP